MSCECFNIWNLSSAFTVASHILEEDWYQFDLAASLPVLIRFTH